MPILELKEVRYKVQEKTILDGITFAVEDGDAIGLLGSSGAGKTTLFRLLNLLQTPTGGSIFYQGKNLLNYQPAALRREIGYVFQKTYLFGNTIRENLMYPYQLHQEKPDMKEIATLLSKANLSDGVLDKKVTELSGGEQQRVALIRSLLVKPRVLLLDEVTASLDEENALLVEKMIAVQQQEYHMTVLFISHNQEQAKRMAQKILYLSQGKIGYFGDKAAYFAEKEVSS